MKTVTPIIFCKKNTLVDASNARSEEAQYQPKRAPTPVDYYFKDKE